MQNFKRVYDWHIELTRYINGARNIPFELGIFDCCILGAGSLDAVCGTNFVSQVMGKYHDPLSAVRFLKEEFNADNVKDLFGSRLPEQHIAYAKQGDIVFQNSNSFGFNAVVGICYGQMSWFIHEEAGDLVQFPTLLCHGSYRVG